MVATVNSATVLGVEGRPVHVEVHVSSGLPAFIVVGQPDAACREARDRVRAAIMSSGLKWPPNRITINLAPASVPKGRGGLDLPIAVGILAASNQVPTELLEGLGFVGELGLDGTVRPVPGLVSLVEAMPVDRTVIPASAEGVDEVTMRELLRVETLTEVADALKAEAAWPTWREPRPHPASESDVPDLADVRGHAYARRAIEISAAGGHHLLLAGPPGSGKSMLARRLPGVLPPPERRDAIDIARIRSAAGLDDLLVGAVPFRAPHHTATAVSIVGGGTSAMRPGEVSLASGGVLFMDELGEFPRSVIEALREPLEEGVVRVCRARAVARFPARFLLVAATNPCPCGGSGGPGSSCKCEPVERRRYVRRLSGPILDRFDLRVRVGLPEVGDLLGGPPGESSSVVAARVREAREFAVSRGHSCNGRLTSSEIDEVAPLEREATARLRIALEKGELSARGLHRVRCVARTIADLEGGDRLISKSHVQEALSLRTSLGSLDSVE